MVLKSLNSNLRQAKNAKKDEFYTQLSDIEKELKHYKEHFKNKVVYCNCDDPRVSNFFHYFSCNFEKLGLKKLITTCYKNKNRDLFSQHDCEQAIYLEYTGDKNNNKVPDPEEIGIHHLKGDGDFRSEESIELLKQADIVVTNPPFSLFRDYAAQLLEYDKKFIIIGHQNAITYKEIFKLIKHNQMWLGNGFKGGAAHFISQHYEDYAAAGDHKEGMIRVSGVVWFTNLEIPKRHENLIRYKQYNPEEYPKYDNYDAINVDKTKDIPMDYQGAMGVPITFLNKYNPDQFEIVGQGQGNLYRELTPKGLSETFVIDYYKTGGTGSIKENHPVLGYYDANGKAVIPYMRIIIKNKNHADRTLWQNINTARTHWHSWVEGTFTKKKVYERRGLGLFIQPVKDKQYDTAKIEADHITPWHKGGKTATENCQMLC